MSKDLFAEIREDFTEPGVVVRDTLGAVTIILVITLLLLLWKGGASND